MLVKSAVWENKEHTALTAIIIDEKLGEIPFGVNLNYKDKSPVYNDIVSKLNTGELIPDDAPEEQLYNMAADSIRERRNSTLISTDKYMLEDYPISNHAKEDIRGYRQQLRDITKQSGFPYNVVWPEMPSGIK